VATFVNVVHPMLPPVMPRERLGILKGLPLTIDLSPGGVVLVLLENSVRQPLCILATMNKETHPINLLDIRFSLT
jgi:hypothetical protein